MSTEQIRRPFVARTVRRFGSLIIVAWLAVTAARAVALYGVSLLLRRTEERFPWSWSAVLTWGGLRGGLSMV
ncbi:MAG TPA: hypothetical protein PKJ04_15190, partial [Nitrospira sp.]|nr:hypothetical protein [Nitrospira sp.]